MGANFYFDNSLHPSNHSSIIKLDTKKAGKKWENLKESVALLGILNDGCMFPSCQCTTPITTL